MSAYICARSGTSRTGGPAGHWFSGPCRKPSRRWTRLRKPRAFSQVLVFTLPGDDNPVTGGPGFTSRSSLNEAIAHCSTAWRFAQRGMWIASPFYDFDNDSDAATSALCKAMARGTTRDLSFCVPVLGDPQEKPIRLAAPGSLRTTPSNYSGSSRFLDPTPTRRGR